jgi:hypothetical protein
VAESRIITDLITGDVAGHPEICAPVRFVYNPADPYAVVLDLTAIREAVHEGSSPVLWTFARQILIPGNCADLDTAGVQDVQAWRSGAWLVVSLVSPVGTGMVRFPAQAVARFAHRTQVAVPSGHESRHMAAAVDAAIARLLGGVR